jgi:hypothetical protein
MDTPSPLFVDIEVPEAVLLPTASFAQITHVHPNTDGAVWYRADTASATRDANDKVQIWHPQDGLGSDATPAKPNTGNLQLSSNGGLAFQSQINSGLIVRDALIEPSEFTIAVRYISDDGEARSLLTVNPTDQDSYLFLAEKDGFVSWQDQQDHSQVSVPAPAGGGWLIAGFNAGSLSLAAIHDNGTLPDFVRTAQPSTEISSALAGASDLFIGCRSHRNGILKTLGSSRIHDVLVWIDQDVTGRSHEILTSVLRYCEHNRGPA